MSTFGSGAFAQRFEVHDEIAEHVAFDIELRRERHAEAGPPAARIFFVRVVR